MTRLRSPAEQALGAFRVGDTEMAARAVVDLLADATEPRDVYPAVAMRIRSWIVAAGTSADALDREEQRLVELLGDPPDQQLLTTAWTALREVGNEALAESRHGAAGPAAALLRAGLDAWILIHDRSCDWIFALLDAAARWHGEEAIGPVWEAALQHMYPSRDAYAPSVRPWAESAQRLVDDAVGAVRSHLGGPARLGAAVVEETAQSWSISFDPCGSGGRMFHADATSDRTARTDPPYRFGVTTRAHDWAWRSPGVCFYCVHCCQLQQQVPIKRIGIPLRVVRPPLHNQPGRSSCTWTVYKDYRAVPADAYEQVGLSRNEEPDPPEARDGRLCPDGSASEDRAKP